MDFKKITDALLSGGQNRRQWLNKKADDLQQGMEYYLGPTGIPDKVQSLGQLLQYSDAGDFVEAGDASRELWDNPSIENAARYATAGAALAVPFVGAKMANDGVDVLGDALRSVSDDIKKFAKGEDGAIKAYHGSPHDFDKFSMDKIGTGEGAQAYGHGLYFAESEDVARSYQTSNSATAQMKYDGKPITDELQQSVAWHLEQNNGDKAAVLENWKSLYKPSYWKTETGKAELDILEKMDPAKLRPGSMYEVNIDANPDDFLDWDAPLSEQPRILEQFGYNDAKYPEDWIPDTNITGAQLYRNYAGDTNSGYRGDSVGVGANQLSAGSSRPIRMKDGTIADKPLNIPGIKYKDAGSRGLDGDGTRNYVVFDENLVSIVKKYGIAGAAAMLGVNASDVHGAMAQGQPDTTGNILSPNAKRQPVMRDYLNQ